MGIGQSELISIIFMTIITIMGLALCYIQKERKLHPEEMGDPDEKKYLKKYYFCRKKYYYGYKVNEITSSSSS